MRSSILTARRLGLDRAVSAADTAAGQRALVAPALFASDRSPEAPLPWGDGIGEPQLDEGLTCHADPLGLAIDRPEEVFREVDVNPLRDPPGTFRTRDVEMVRQILSGIVERIELCGGLSFSPRSTALLLLRAPDGPR